MPSSVMQCPACGTRNRVANDTAGRPRCSSCHTDLPWLSNVTAASSTRWSARRRCRSWSTSGRRGVDRAVRSRRRSSSSRSTSPDRFVSSRSTSTKPRRSRRGSASRGSPRWCCSPMDPRSPARLGRSRATPSVDGSTPPSPPRPSARGVGRGGGRVAAPVTRRPRARMQPGAPTRLPLNGAPDAPRPRGPPTSPRHRRHAQPPRSVERHVDRADDRALRSARRGSRRQRLPRRGAHRLRPLVLLGPRPQGLRGRAQHRRPHHRAHRPALHAPLLARRSRPAAHAPARHRRHQRPLLRRRLLPRARRRAALREPVGHVQQHRHRQRAHEHRAGRELAAAAPHRRRAQQRHPLHRPHRRRGRGLPDGTRVAASSTTRHCSTRPSTSPRPCAATALMAWP